MQKRKVMMMILLVFILAIGAVNAADNASSDIVTINGDLNHTLDASSDEILTDGPDSFKNLNAKINGNNNSSIDLDRDYLFTQKDKSFEYGIKITRNITINGNGHTIDADKNGRIFKIEGCSVVLNDIKFVNADVTNYSTSGAFGGAINLENCHAVISNCSFANSSGSRGGAIYAGSDTIIDKCFFADCYASNSGGAVWSVNNKCTIQNSSFVNCSSRYSGGAVLGCDAINSSFDACHSEGGGAMTIGTFDDEYSVNMCHAKNCSFLNCHAFSGGALEYVEAVDSTFINCNADYAGGAIYTADSFNSIFINCTCDNGAAIYSSYGYESTVNCTFIDCAGKSDVLDHAEVCNCTFRNCSSEEWAVVSLSINNIYNSTFVNCYSEWGIVRTYGGVFNSSFVKCSSGEDSWLVCKSLSDCIFEKTYSTAEYKISLVVEDTIKNCIFKGYKKSDLGSKWWYETFMNCTFIDENGNVYYEIIANNQAMVYSSNDVFKVRFKKLGGNPQKDALVTFKIDGKVVHKANTDKNGYATYAPKLAPNKYKITVQINGKSITKTLTVKHIVTLKTATFKKSAKKLTLQATLAKVNGKYLKNKQIIFKINGKKVATAKTNSKGIAKITIKNPNIVKNLKVGKKVTYQATYLKDTVKKTSKLKM